MIRLTFIAFVLCSCSKERGAFYYETTTIERSDGESVTLTRQSNQPLQPMEWF